MSVDFVHLHTHTSYSLLDGACKVNELMKATLKAGMKAVAITDHGVMYGVVDFYKQALKAGVKPIIGCEVYEAIGSRFDRKSERQGTAPNHHLVLLASDNEGYKNLIKIVSAAHLEGFYYKPRVDEELLSKHSKGIIALSACLKGKVSETLLKEGESEASKVIGHYVDIFGKNNFFLELQDHGISEQKKVNEMLVRMSKKLSAPLVATNDVHYLEKSHSEAHEVLLCIQTGTVMSDPDRMKYASSEFYFKTPEEMQKLFIDFPEALQNTVEIAHRCTVELDFDHTFFPAFTPPEGYSQEEYLYKLCCEGLKRIYGIEVPEKPKTSREKELVDRIKFEIGVIKKTGYVGYFLVVWDFVNFAKNHNIPVGPGRGSGAGSLVAYCLGITGIDPLRYGLFFERFLNPDRVSPPDFDIDFCQFRRGEVVEYVKEKYGRENVAQIITFGMLGAKTVIRDVGRVLEVPLSYCDKLAKLVPGDPKITLEKALKESPELEEEVKHNENAKKIIKHAKVIEGLLRNAGVHAAGVVIGDRPLVEHLPLAKDKEGEIVTQFSKDYVESLGLLKADFLGLKTLSVIDETLKLIKQFKNIVIDIDNIPLDDKATFELLKKGNTIGVFQLESKGMRELAKNIALNSVEDLMDMIALYRPGPMQFIDDFIECKTGRRKIVYPHPKLEPILSKTYGFFVYQEQVQQAAQVLAGFTLSEGDILRRAMGKKKPEEMAKQKEKFIEGCHKVSALSKEKAEELFNVIAKFAEYGFNKSHSAGYAILAYQTAYLKTHFPQEFMAALISSEIGDYDHMPVLIGEAYSLGIKVLPPDINKSDVRFMPEGDAIRYGFAGIKNIGAGTAIELVKERKNNGEYKDVLDFCSRNENTLNKKIMETLVRCGAFDSSGEHRAQLFNSVDNIMKTASFKNKIRKEAQNFLFSIDEIEEKSSYKNIFIDAPEWEQSELLNAERELLGVYMSGHPLVQYTESLKRYALATTTSVLKLQDNSFTRLGGLIVKADKKYVASNNGKEKRPMAILKIEDTESSIEGVVYCDAYQTFEKNIVVGEPIIACGQIRHNDDTARIIVNEIYPLELAPQYFAEREIGRASCRERV
jgi:DNA polymerase-3 subunit alpha